MGFRFRAGGELLKTKQKTGRQNVGRFLKGKSRFGPHGLWPGLPDQNSEDMHRTSSLLGARGKSEREIHSSSSFPLENVSHSAQILPQNEEMVHTKWPLIAVHRLWLVLFLRRPGGLRAGGLFGDGGDLGRFGPAAGSSRGVRGVGADGASVLQL